jgi:hypothetical protein
MARRARLAELTSRAAVQAALDEFVRLGRESFLNKYGYGPSRDHFVIDPSTGTSADSKAIVGVAFGIQHPARGPLRPGDFSGGDATVGALLQTLGFVVTHQGAQVAGEDWSRDEVELIVADYLAMLSCELARQPYNKSAHRRQLMQRLPGRSGGSIEFKHCNISAVMLQLKCPYIAGYQPRVNFQRSVLLDVVSRQVLRHPQLDELALSAVEQPAVAPVHSDFSKVMAEAPPLLRDTRAEEPTPSYLRAAVRRDYLAREEHNRSLGQAGEAFALDFERWRLVQMGVGQLADKVRHVSVTEGDGLSYDIHSFEPDGRDRFIEVKTTGFGERTPFFVSANELRFARDHEQAFRLYRLFDFRKWPVRSSSTACWTPPPTAPASPDPRGSTGSRQSDLHCSSSTCPLQS